MFTINGLPEMWRMRALARFMSKIDDSNGTGCWQWQGSMYPSGYGQFFYGSIEGRERNGKAHKAAWRLLVGEIPDGFLVLHKCHNSRCCNPDHLYIGTHMENMKDRDDSGRTSRGEHRYNFKRDGDLNAKIGELRAQGLKIEMICEQLGIGKSTYYRCARAGAVDPEANRKARSANMSAENARRAA